MMLVKKKYYKYSFSSISRKLFYLLALVIVFEPWIIEGTINDLVENKLCNLWFLNKQLGKL